MEQGDYVYSHAQKRQWNCETFYNLSDIDSNKNIALFEVSSRPRETIDYIYGPEK